MSNSSIWRVAKMGLEMFDALHAYGLSITIATASGKPTSLKDEGVTYLVTGELQAHLPMSVDLLDLLFPLPSSNNLIAGKEKLYIFEHDTQEATSFSLAIATLDGLLAALFTVPLSVRAATVSRLVAKTTEEVEQKITGIRERIEEWKSYIERAARGSPNWVTDLLQDYTATRPVSPILREGNSKRDINALMTLDPSLGYSFRAALNTGHLTRKTNLAVSGTRYATLLALIGAARCLRAQYLSGNLVNFYVPLATTWTIHAYTCLPCLHPLNVSADHALVKHWLTCALPPECTWRALAYQTLQRQGQQQSICSESGTVSYTWLSAIEQITGKQIVATWKGWLEVSGCNALSLDEQRHLIESLKYQRTASWYVHLCDMARYHHTYGASHTPHIRRAYTLEEVRTVSAMMENHNIQGQPAVQHPLRVLLERKEGTLRFGHALRLLGRVNPSLLRDFIEMLEPVDMLEQLLIVLHQVTRECELAITKSRFIVVPTDDDLILLIEDVYQHGVRLIVSLLMILSALRYPQSEDTHKYALQTYINLLLLLIRYTSLSKDEQAAYARQSFETITAIPEDFPFSEGEPENGH